MSLLINDTDMPTSCFNCRFCYLFREYCDDEVYWISTKQYKCKGIEKSPAFEREDDLINGKLPNCPLTEIPTPHGDLIDRDDLLAYFDRKAKGKTAEEALKLLYTTLKAYPTVIEAEE